MNGDADNRIEPVCKFGPGGDFVSVWPPEPSKSPQRRVTSLSEVLACIRQIMGKPEDSEVDVGSSWRAGVRRLAEQHLRQKEDSEYAGRITEAANAAYAAPAAGIKGGRLFSGEQRLFADDWGTGMRAQHKPKHRFRAHRRAAKKRAADSLPGQGTLFELDFRSAKSA